VLVLRTVLSTPRVLSLVICQRPIRQPSALVIDVAGAGGTELVGVGPGTDCVGVAEELEDVVGEALGTGEKEVVAEGDTGVEVGSEVGAEVGVGSMLVDEVGTVLEGVGCGAAEFPPLPDMLQMTPANRPTTTARASAIATIPAVGIAPVSLCRSILLLLIPADYLRLE